MTDLTKQRESKTRINPKECPEHPRKEHVFRLVIGTMRRECVRCGMNEHELIDKVGDK